MITGTGTGTKTGTGTTTGTGTVTGTGTATETGMTTGIETETVIGIEIEGAIEMTTGTTPVTDPDVVPKTKTPIGHPDLTQEAGAEIQTTGLDVSPPRGLTGQDTQTRPPEPLQYQGPGRR